MRRWKWKLTTRRLMVLVALSAVAMCGLNRGDQVGWHLGIPGTGLRAGVCRNDGQGRSLMAGGEPGTHVYQAGVWRAGDRAGAIRLGLRIQDGTVTAWAGDAIGPVLW
jgi:hypothetical protein